MAGGGKKEPRNYRERELNMLKYSFCFIILFSSFISAGNGLSGIWLNIGISDEGVYNNEPYSGTMYPDTIEYMMIVDSLTCKAFALHDDRIYSASNLFTISNDSIYSQNLGIPLTWEKSNDTLFTSMLYIDNNEWEKVTFIFISTHSSQFPDNWPKTSGIYIPDELSPFGPYSFATSPDNLLPTNKPANKATNINTVTYQVHIFNLMVVFAKKSPNNLTQIMIYNDINNQTGKIYNLMK